MEIAAGDLRPAGHRQGDGLEVESPLLGLGAKQHGVVLGGDEEVGRLAAVGVDHAELPAGAQVGKIDFGVGRGVELAPLVEIDLHRRALALGDEHGHVGAAVAVHVAIGRRQDRLPPGRHQVVRLREAAERVGLRGRHLRPAGRLAGLDAGGDEVVGHAAAVAAEHFVGAQGGQLLQAA